ncbi:hypothetical protein [Herbaspirillum frisingense]|uniref:hypothetical protein n=1 Tax=Herbaspirillum frisingense TaxID=92645 RepID=UPI001F18CA6E|nr:hypothetical protein [Herbaspirillum frisingense]UIN22576.1 hypothetical protein LAZ82_05580 [Herbaspirillum frisingense]
MANSKTGLFRKTAGTEKSRSSLDKFSWSLEMAYISQRGQYWRAEARRRSIKPIYRTFDTQKKAQQWARKVESEIDAGLE